MPIRNSVQPWITGMKHVKFGVFQSKCHMVSTLPSTVESFRRWMAKLSACVTSSKNNSICLSSLLRGQEWVSLTYSDFLFNISWHKNKNIIRICTTLWIKQVRCQLLRYHPGQWNTLSVCPWPHQHESDKKNTHEWWATMCILQNFKRILFLHWGFES